MEKYGKITVKERYRKDKRIWVRGVCDCGQEIDMRWGNVQRGRSTQCIKCSYVERGKKLKGQGIVTGDLLAARDSYCDRKYRAKKADREFSISFEEYYELSKQDCFYCGGEPANRNLIPGKDWAEPFVYNGMDRVDSSQGYTTDNVVACCWKCNYMKRENSTEEFLAHVVRIANHLTR